MSTHQYACPKCGVALESAQDVAGRKVRCLGCLTVFVAGGDRAEPTRASRRTAAEPVQQYVPPLPRSRQFPVVGFLVVGGALALAVGLTIFFGIKYKNRLDDNESKVAVQKIANEKATASVKTAPPKAAPSKPTSQPVAQRKEEEEEPPVSPAVNPDSGTKPTDSGAKPRDPEPKPPAKKDDLKIPDIGSLLPKLPGPELPVAKKGDTPASPPETKQADPKPEAVEPVRGDGQIPPKLLESLKAATVFVKVRGRSFQGSGSGFVLKVDGDTALIVTNQHVAEPKSREGVVERGAELEVVFHSGRSKEFSRKAELIAADADHDLAVIQVSGVRNAENFPTAINTKDLPALAETTPIYIIGFPFGEGLALAKGGNPAVTISRGTITSLRDDEAGDTVFIQIDADANPGNSGGPVVDGRGRLVGVLKGGKPGTKINFAIPNSEVIRMVTGRVSDLEFRVNKVVRDTIEMDVRGSLIDPMGHVASASLRVVRADDLKGKPKVGADGKWAALEGSENAELKIAGKSVTTRVDLPLRARDRGEIDILFQPACTDKEGRTHYFAPVSQTVRLVEGPPAARVPGPGGVGGPPPGMNPGGPGVPPGGPGIPRPGPMFPGGGPGGPRPGAPPVPPPPKG
jgi:S1-C subfamily serine protease